MQIAMEEEEGVMALMNKVMELRSLLVHRRGGDRREFLLQRTKYRTEVPATPPSSFIHYQYVGSCGDSADRLKRQRHRGSYHCQHLLFPLQNNPEEKGPRGKRTRQSESPRWNAEDHGHRNI